MDLGSNRGVSVAGRKLFLTLRLSRREEDRRTSFISVSPLNDVLTSSK